LTIPEGGNLIVAQSHFIKTVEDIYEAMVNTLSASQVLSLLGARAYLRCGAARGNPDQCLGPDSGGAGSREYRLRHGKPG